MHAYHENPNLAGCLQKIRMQHSSSACACTECSSEMTQHILCTLLIPDLVIILLSK